MDIKTTLKSLMMLGIIAALLGGATYAVFSDTETSIGNQMVAGTIDFSVDDENPWTDTTWSDDLGDMKPCVVHYGEFNITNVGVNPMNLWKRLTITEQNGGDVYYYGPSSSEPEYVAGGGLFVGGIPTGTDYAERCNIASYTLYDMTVTIYDEVGIFVMDEVIINETNQVRLDNVNGVWIALPQLEPKYTMTVNQSYHLSSWVGAAEAEVGNWAQGDQLLFDVELYGEQVTGPGKNVGEGTVMLRAKDTTTWVPLTGANNPVGILTFEKAGPTFDYDFDAVGLTPDVSYTLIYYADLCGVPGALIGTGTASTAGALNMNGQSRELNMDLPAATDANAPAGAKIWLVPTVDYNAGTNLVTGWNNMADFLYEMNLITYDDTEV